jgi:serine/threonine-protein kinase
VSATATAPTQAANEPELDPGYVVDGRYQIKNILGTGGVGVVYRAKDKKLPHDVAIKVLQKKHASHPSLRARFEREAKALAALHHPNIVSVSDYGIADGRPFVVMELLSGLTLREVIDRGPVEPDRAFEITKQLLRGLSYAHNHGLVHRDIKPGNVFLQEIENQPEVVKILDFGFAKWLVDQPDANPNLSKEGMVMGTPSYLPPEQAAGEATDARTDIYAVGVLLFEMLAGVKPFTGTLIELLRQHLTAKVPRISQVSRTRKETPELRKLIERAMAKKPGDRFTDASQFLKAIDTLPKPAIRKKGRGAMVAAVGGLALACAFAGAVTWVATRPDPRAEMQRLQASAQSIFSSVEPSDLATPTRTGSVEDGIEDVADETNGDPAGTTADAAIVAETQSDPATGTTGGSSTTSVAEEPPVDVIRDVRQLVDQRLAVSDDQVTILRTYARENDSGAAYLLLAHVYSQRNWWSDAVRNYRSAFEAEPRIKDDPAVLDNLLHISAMSEASNIEAFDVVKRIYGRDALPAVEAILEDQETSWQEKRQLRRLRRELVRLPRSG